MIIVTGANGQLGRSVFEQLLARIPADQIGLSVSDPEKASAVAQRGVRVRLGDFAEPATLLFRASRRGDFATDDRSLERLIGHPPTAIRAVLTSEDSSRVH